MSLVWEVEVKCSEIVVSSTQATCTMYSVNVAYVSTASIGYDAIRYDTVD